MKGTHSTFRGLLLAICVLVSCLTSRGQDHPMDLRELSLKELLSLDLTEIHPGETTLFYPNTFYTGAWTFGYRYLFQQMKDYMDGRDRINPKDLLSEFAIVQGDMTQEMHILEAAYSPTDRLTLLAGIPFIRQTTGHQRRPGPNPFVGETFDVTTSGLSDVSLKAAYTLYQTPKYKIVLHGGVSLPTGSINETGRTPLGASAPLPYTMQLGSGTYDLDPGIAYAAQSENWSWGAEFVYKVRLGRNSAGYNFGDRCATTVYLSRRFNDWFAPSLLLIGRGWNQIDGRDSRLDRARTRVPVADPDLYGGDRLDLTLRLNFAIPTGILKGNRFTLEGGLPIYQKLMGPQMRADYRLGASWQWTF